MRDDSYHVHLTLHAACVAAGDGATAARVMAHIDALGLTSISAVATTCVRGVEVAHEDGIEHGTTAEEYRSSALWKFWHRVVDDTPTFQIWAQYHDRFVRTAEGWRFSERRVRAAGQEGANNDFPGIGRRTPDPALVEKVRSRAGE